jgi:hypothetical protein
MRLAWVPIYVVMLGIGSVGASVLPRSWGFTTPYGYLMGTALYFATFQRYLVRERGAPLDAPLRWTGPGGLLAPVLRRAGLFLLVLAALLYVVCGALRTIDLRCPLTILAAWSVHESLLERRSLAVEREGRS